jgi:hypothetical protein
MQCYGVWQPIVANHLNGVLFLTNSMLVAHGDGWGAGFDNTQSFSLLSYAGVLSIANSEIQNSTAASSSSYGLIIQGGEVYINNSTIEVNVPFQISGRLEITGGRILNTQSTTDQFYIGASASASTVLSVRSAFITRADNVGSFSGNYLVNNTSSSSNISIEFTDCSISEWGSFNNLASDNYEKVTIKNCKYKPTLGDEVTVIDKDKTLIHYRDVDTVGYTLDGLYRNDYFGGGSTALLNADVPNSNYVNSVEVIATGQNGVFTIDYSTLATVNATGIRVTAGQILYVGAYAKLVSGSACYIGISCVDSAGVPLTTPFYAIENTQEIASSWKFVFGRIIIPATAAYIGIGAYGTTGTIRVAGIRANIGTIGA